MQVLMADKSNSYLLFRCVGVPWALRYRVLRTKVKSKQNTNRQFTCSHTHNVCLSGSRDCSICMWCFRQEWRALLESRVHAWILCLKEVFLQAMPLEDWCDNSNYPSILFHLFINAFNLRPGSVNCKQPWALNHVAGFKTKSQNQSIISLSTYENVFAYFFPI